MPAHPLDFSHTIAFADAALGHIKRLKLSADPASYEVWYSFVGGHDFALKQAINGILSRKGAVAQSEVDDLQRRYFLAGDRAHQINRIGEQLGDEVDQVVGMIEAAIGVAATLDQDLGDSNRRLANPMDRKTLRGIVEAVISATKEMQQENARLGHSLHELRQDISKLQKNLVSITMASLTDPLTGLANRRHFDQVLAEATAEAEGAMKPLSLLLADIDEFKRFNDRHGHQLGDHVLRLIAAALRQNVKGQDLVARYGGEEFAIILPNTDLKQAVTVAERLRQAVAANEILKRPSGENLGRASLSIGVATLHASEPQALIEVADACLYAAKKAGRNRVVSEADLNPGSWWVD